VQAGTVRKYLAAVFEENHSVAQQAPPLFGVAGDHVRRIAIKALGVRAAGFVGADTVRE
jgi:hypothetical protein